MSMTFLPSISEMYLFAKQNHDYNVIRRHQSVSTLNHGKRSITKKGHYIDDTIRMCSSPGPASNIFSNIDSANIQPNWQPTNLRQCKHSERKTYIDDVQRNQKKKHMPSPNHYALTMPWPGKCSELKHISDKTNFIDTCQYESNHNPGPGTYIVRTQIGCKEQIRKFVPHKPLKINQCLAANMNTYDPCPVEYQTFKNIERVGKKQVNHKKQQLSKGAKKENCMPGPGAYQVINSWKGKQPLKKNQLSYLNNISKSPQKSIYYH